jgi:hypothetical protein
LSPGTSFITQSVDNVEKIAIVALPVIQGRERTIYITEQAEIKHIYNFISYATEIRVHERPRDPRMHIPCPNFAIRLEYRNGEVDIFLRAPSGTHIFRFLDTIGRRGYRGYIVGSNPSLVQYIDDLKGGI